MSDGSNNDTSNVDLELSLSIANTNTTDTNTNTKRKNLAINLSEHHPSHPYDKLYDYKDNVTDIDKILIRMRKNCVYLSMYHNRRYHFYKNILFCVFSIPLIILSALNSFFAVGTQIFFKQETISLINAIISLFCGVLTSVELLWQLKERTQQELLSHKDFYKLSLDIFRFLQLDSVNREKEEKQFLSETYSIYQKYIENGNAVNVYRRGFLDELEYINDTDKSHVTVFLKQKIEDDLNNYYFSSCCL
ncbi:MAG: hypothetical protein EBS86_09560 [Crocinitomicaceae bacterium]|nr:hypothetical protein [Crocinitomicaceae bacterium]